MSEHKRIDVSIVMPCLNEAEALGHCIEEALSFLAACGLQGEIIVVDNGSTDGSDEIAQSRGVKVLKQPRRGYGAAYQKGFAVAQGWCIIMVDSDDTYDLQDASAFLDLLRDGADFVVGSRLKGNLLPGAMPWLNRYVGVPVLTWLLNRVAGCRISDAHCGLRAVRREALATLTLRSEGMEFASEILVETARQGFCIKEVPVSYRPRRGQSKLRPIRDGCRHLKLLLTYLPGSLMP